MPKQKSRKPRGKIRQQVRWAIDDHTLWDDDLLTTDVIDFKPVHKEHKWQPDRSRNKPRIRREPHTDYDYEPIDR